MSVLPYFAFLAPMAGVAVILVMGWQRRNIPAAVNALVSLLLVLVLVLVDVVSLFAFDRGIAVGPELPLAVALIGLLHSYGMLGPYDEIWWWDHLTHTLAAGLIATLLYSAITATTSLSDPHSGILTVVSTVGLGMFWELIELAAREFGKRHDIEPVLVHYGWRDTILDLLFDLLGAVIVVVVGLRPFVANALEFPVATRTLLVGTAFLVGLGSVLLGVVVMYTRFRNRS